MIARVIAVCFSLLLFVGGVAWAAGTGLVNPSFEQGSGSNLDGWTVSAYAPYDGDGPREQVYGPGQDPVPCIDGDPYGICVVEGADTFQAQTSSGSDEQQVTVPVLDGDKMVRLGGPFKNSGIRQSMDSLAIEQSFEVDPDNPIVKLNYNLFTYDYSGYDDLYLRVRLTSPDMPTVTERYQGGFGSGIDLKSTGWRNAHMDLTDYAGQEVNLEVELRGTSDRLYGTWAYVDAGTAPESVVSPTGTTMSAPETTPGGDPLMIHKYADESAGQVYFTIPSSQVSQFPEGCMPIDLAIPINPGAGTVSDVSVLFAGSTIPATETSENTWTVSIPCAMSGSLFVTYTLTEGEDSNDFVIPFGSITLIDPQGVVYDQDEFDAAKSDGKTDEEARAAAAIEGATVRLQRKVGDSFVNVLSGDPGISPNVNPELTGSDGLFQWDVAAGTYRVVVSMDGYPTVTSQAVDIPPPVLDLHVAMTKTPAPTHTLSVESSGTGSGTVTSIPSGIDCGSDCVASYDEGSEVTLTAAAATGSSFAGWSGACTGTGDCHVTLSEAKSVTATFTLQKRTLTVSKSGAGSGTVTSAPAGVNCGSSCTADFDFGTEVTLTPTAGTGSSFTGWSGACTGTGTCKVTMSEARSVTASFDKDTVLPTGKPKFGALRITPKAKSVKKLKKAIFKVKVKNAGDAAATTVKVCAKAPKKLAKVSKCVKLGTLAAGASKTASISVKVTKKAKKGKKIKVAFTVTGKGVAKKTGSGTLKVKK